MRVYFNLQTIWSNRELRELCIFYFDDTIILRHGNKPLILKKWKCDMLCVPGKTAREKNLPQWWYLQVKQSFKFSFTFLQRSRYKMNYDSYSVPRYSRSCGNRLASPANESIFFFILAHCQNCRKFRTGFGVVSDSTWNHILPLESWNVRLPPS